MDKRHLQGKEAQLGRKSSLCLEEEGMQQAGLAKHSQICSILVIMERSHPSRSAVVSSGNDISRDQVGNQQSWETNKTDPLALTDKEIILPY